jgi:ATP-dependent Clp protease ATP-binding subunit ClpC
VDYSVIPIYLVLAFLVFGFIFRARLRAWWIRRKLKSAVVSSSPIEPPLLSTRLYELNKVFEPFGSAAAHPSALYAQRQFVEAAELLAAPAISLAVVMQYVEGNSWSLSSAALAALRKRPDRADALQRVCAQCEYFSPWTMYFGLQLLFETEPRRAVGEPLARAKEWWIENRWMPNIFRDYLANCAQRGDLATFGAALLSPGASHDIIRKFLQRITHPSAAALIKEIDDARPAPAAAAPAAPPAGTLNAVGRFWIKYKGADVLIEPDGWRAAFALAESTLRHEPPRSLLVSGEPLVGKTSFLQLLSRRVGQKGWSVFEASGADLQADQIYIGQLEGRIRHVIDELAAGYKLIWYIPDVVQVAMSGRHQGQSATMLDQIIPAITAGRLVVWCEATPKGTAQLVQIKPSMRGLFETVTIDALSSTETLSLARGVIDDMADDTEIHFDPECAEVALDTATQYLGTSGLPGSALFMLKLAAAGGGGGERGRGEG